MKLHVIVRFHSTFLLIEYCFCFLRLFLAEILRLIRRAYAYETNSSKEFSLLHDLIDQQVSPLTMDRFISLRDRLVHLYDCCSKEENHSWQIHWSCQINRMDFFPSSRWFFKRVVFYWCSRWIVDTDVFNWSVTAEFQRSRRETIVTSRKKTINHHACEMFIFLVEYLIHRSCHICSCQRIITCFSFDNRMNFISYKHGVFLSKNVLFFVSKIKTNIRLIICVKYFAHLFSLCLWLVVLLEWIRKSDEKNELFDRWNISISV